MIFPINKLFGIYVFENREGKNDEDAEGGHICQFKVSEEFKKNSNNLMQNQMVIIAAS